MDEKEFLRERVDALEAFMALVSADPRIEGMWVQGRLARGEADPLSDIDAYFSDNDDKLSEVLGKRAPIVEKARPVIAWSDATTPRLKAIRVLRASVRYLIRQ